MFTFNLPETDFSGWAEVGNIHRHTHTTHPPSFHKHTHHTHLTPSTDTTYLPRSHISLPTPSAPFTEIVLLSSISESLPLLYNQVTINTGRCCFWALLSIPLSFGYLVIWENVSMVPTVLLPLNFECFIWYLS